MPSVVLAGLQASDPPGSGAVREAVRRGLPNHDVLEAATSGEMRSLFRGARSGDAVIVAGANLPSSLPALASAASVSSACRCILACVGLGSEPLRGVASATLARHLLARAELLLVDDEQSAANLAAAGLPTPLRVAADPAWMALAVEQDPPVQGESVAVVVDGRSAPAVESSLAAALVTVARAGRQVRIVPWCRADPAEASLVSRLVLTVLSAVPFGAVKEQAPRSLPEAAAWFAGCHAVVAMRRRAVNAAAAAGVPAIAVPGEAGVASAASRLGQPTVHPEELVAGLPVAIERIADRGRVSRETVMEEIGRAAAGLTLLRLVLEPDAVAPAEIDHLPLVPVPWL